jgi:hypothetical protein
VICRCPTSNLDRSALGRDREADPALVRNGGFQGDRCGATEIFHKLKRLRINE